MAERSIAIMNNGPYIVSGSIPVSLQMIKPDDEGGSSEWVEGKAFSTPAQYALCRCGASKKKPFCDGTHATIGFDGTETPTVLQSWIRQNGSMVPPCSLPMPGSCAPPDGSAIRTAESGIR